MNQMTNNQTSDTDAEVDATDRLVRSIAGSITGVDNAGDSVGDDHLLPLARTILTSSVGGNNNGGPSGTGGCDRLVRRRIKKSYQRSRLGGSGASASSSSILGTADPVHRQVVEREVLQTMSEVEGLVRRLAVAEGRHRIAHGRVDSGSASGGKESAAVTDGVVRALSRLVATEGWDAAVGIGNTSGGAGRRPMTISATTATSAPGSHGGDNEAPSSSLPGQGKPSAVMPQFQPQQQSFLHEESLILRDCLFALQGINSERVRYHDNASIDQKANEEGFVGDTARDCSGVRVRPTLLPFHGTLPLQMDIRSDRVLGSGSVDALRICGEAGWLYRRVLSYVKGVRDGISRGGGAVGRALASALSAELAEYHRLVSILEAQLTSQISTPGSGTDNARHQPQRLDKKVLTVRQLLVHLRPAIVRLRTLATVVDSLPAPTTDAGVLCSGGKLIMAIQLHAHHGDTRHSTLLHSLVAQAADPWFEMLWRWTTNGTLPAGSAMSGRNTGAREFFVAEDLSVPDTHLWHRRYVLLRDSVPLGVISMVLAERALVLGKGLNFIRSCLGDVRWELEMGLLQDLVQQSGQQATSDKSCLGYRYDTKLPSVDAGCSHSGSSSTILSLTISRMAQQVNSHILQSLRDKHHLQTHLWALKQFLLLGRGDFASALMDGLHRELDARSGDSRRVGSGEMDGVYVHTLMSVVETALRNTNAKHLPSYVLGRLRVDLLAADSSKDERPDAWDAFHLCYDVDAPLTAVVHPEATSLYRRVFALLFRLKRIVYMLNRTWRQSTALHHALRQIALAYPDSSIESRQSTLHLLRRVALTRQSILHFASNLQSYLMFEVVEGGYEVMANRVANATSLDDVIAAHDEYLHEIVRKSLLESDDDDGDADGEGNTTVVNGSGGVEDSPASTQASAGEPSLGNELTRVLDASLRFCRVHSTLFEMALKSVDKATIKRRAAERRAKAGDWGYDDVDRDVDGSNLFESLSDESQLLAVESIANEFDEALGKLLAALDRTLNEGPTQTQNPVASGKSSASGSGGPWWRRGGCGSGVDGFQRMPAASWSNDDSLRCLAFRLDFNEYYDRVGFGGDDAASDEEEEKGDDV